VINFEALRVDPAALDVPDEERTEATGQQVPVEDVGVGHQVGLPVAQGLDFRSRAVGLDERGVTGADAARARTIGLAVLDADPAVVEGRVEERGTIMVHGGEGEDDHVTVESGAHAYIVTHEGECVWNWLQIFRWKVWRVFPHTLPQV